MNRFNIRPSPYLSIALFMLGVGMTSLSPGSPALLCRSIFNANHFENPIHVVGQFEPNERSEETESSQGGVSYFHPSIARWQDSDGQHIPNGSLQRVANFKRRIENTDITKPILLAKTISSFQNRLPNLKGSSGLSFKASTLNPNLIYTLKFYSRTQEIELETEFKVNTSLTQISIPWEKFRAVDSEHARRFHIQKMFSGNEKRHFKSILRDEVGFSLELKPELNIDEIKAGRIIQLQIFDAIVFEVDLREKNALDNVLRLMANVRPHGDWNKDHLDSRSAEAIAIDQVVRKMVDNLYLDVNQKEAIRFAKMGPEALLAELKQLQINPVVLDGQLGVNFFRDSEVALKRPAVPIESGLFGVDHGEWSHAMQVIAMTRGMTKAELEVFREVLIRCFGSLQDGWSFWDLVFDAPGNRLPNSPRFWRDRIVEAKN